MKQLISISETIQKLNKSKFPPDHHVISRTFVTKINGKKGYVGTSQFVKLSIASVTVLKSCLFFRI